MYFYIGVCKISKIRVSSESSSTLQYVVMHTSILWNRFFPLNDQNMHNFVPAELSEEELLLFASKYLWVCSVAGFMATMSKVFGDCYSDPQL